MSLEPQKEHFKEENLDVIINKLNDLYIMTRFKYLSMYLDSNSNTSKWSTISNWFLTDYNIKKHLLKESTIGVFSGQELTKFICFDIDSPSLPYSKHLTQLLFYTLTQEFNVPFKNIVTSFSGKKGYHVELFFSEAISLSLAQSFHQVVIEHLLLLSEDNELYGDIEFRPSFTQGVKIPLSVHKVTGNVCNYVDNDSLIAITNQEEYILSIEKLDVDLFKSKVLDSMLCDITNDNFFTLENKKAYNTEELLNEVKPYAKLTETYIEEIEEVLVENKLLKNGTRNNVTLQLAIYLKNIGETKSTSKKIITKVMDNTWENHRHLIDVETTYSYVIEEIERITEYVYSKLNVSSKSKKEYRIYKSELLKILEIPTKPLRKLMFSLYIHSKKYSKQNGNFYMAYSVIAKMGNSSNPSIVLKHLLKLEELGYIEIVQRNKTNSAMTIEKNKGKSSGYTKISETNIYKVLLEEPTELDTHLTVNLNENIDLVDSVVNLVPEKEAKEKLPDKQFYREYKTVYKKAPAKDI